MNKKNIILLTKLSCVVKSNIYQCSRSEHALKKELSLSVQISEGETSPLHACLQNLIEVIESSSFFHTLSQLHCQRNRGYFIRAASIQGDIINNLLGGGNETAFRGRFRMAGLGWMF